MINLSCICGSRAYNLQTKESDTDLVIIANEGWQKKVDNKDGYNILYNTPTLLWERLIGIKEYAHIWQFFYPLCFTECNFLTEYINENREKIVRASLPYIYKSFSNYFENCLGNIEGLYVVRRKCICYAFLYASVLYNYANGMSFDKCLCPEAEWHNILIGIREENVCLEQCLELKEKYAKKIRDVELYFRYPENKGILEEFKKIIESQDYMSYEDIVLSNKLVSR